jgi:hypothetical protein
MGHNALAVSRLRFTLALLPLITIPTLASAQSPAAPPPVILTADQDRQNMMDQLGIKVLHPGPSGDEQSPNHANDDESKANPYPNIPDPLTLNDGQKVTTPAMWWNQRRPELIEMFSKYVNGRVPANVPKVTWTVVATDHEMLASPRSSPKTSSARSTTPPNRPHAQNLHLSYQSDTSRQVSA